jgi:hypothetical protein
LVDAHVLEPLLQLLQEDQDTTVKVSASAALCNLILDFSPMKKVIVASLISMLIALVDIPRKGRSGTCCPDGLFNGSRSPA